MHLQNGGWVECGRAEAAAEDGRRRFYTHPDSPAPGHMWMRQAVSFVKVKITNNPLNSRNDVRWPHRFLPSFNLSHAADQ